MCHLPSQNRQHMPCPLRPHTLLQPLRLAGLHGNGQVPCVSLGDPGSGPGTRSSHHEDWRRPPHVGGRLGLALSRTLHRENVQPILFLKKSRRGWLVTSTAESGRPGTMALLFPQQVVASGTGRSCSLSPHRNCFPDGGPRCRQGSAVVSGLLVPLLISMFLCVQGLPRLWADCLAQTLST